MKFLKIKSVVFGFIVGAITASSVTAFGIAYASGKVEAWVQDKQIRIIVDDQPIAIPEDMHVLNYNGRIYTPARLVAEAVGASVGWSEEMQAVIIKSPEPEIVEVEVVKEVEKQGSNSNQNSSTKYRYSPLPVRTIKEGIRISITQMELFQSQAELVMDFENFSDYPIMFIKEQTYLEVDGVKYSILRDQEGRFDNSTDQGFSREDMRLIFEAIPIDAEEVKINMVYELYKRVYTNDPYPFITFEFYINPADEDRYNFSK